MLFETLPLLSLSSYKIDKCARLASFLACAIAFLFKMSGRCIINFPERLFDDLRHCLNNDYPLSVCVVFMWI